MFNNYFLNIGAKIKKTAKIVFGIETIISILLAFVGFSGLFSDKNEAITLVQLLSSAFIYMLAWFSFVLLYTYGILIEKVTLIEKNVNAICNSSP